MVKKQPLMIQINIAEREKIELLAGIWGLSLAGVIRRLVREYKLDTEK